MNLGGEHEREKLKKGQRHVYILKLKELSRKKKNLKTNPVQLNHFKDHMCILPIYTD